MIFALHIYFMPKEKKVSTIFASIYGFYGFDPKRFGRTYVLFSLQRIWQVYTIVETN